MLKLGLKCQDFLGVQGQNYWSDWKWQLYVVTYYKVTQFYREPFCLSCIRENLKKKTESYYDTNDLYQYIKRDFY